MDFADGLLLTTECMLGKYLFTHSLFIYDMA